VLVSYLDDSGTDKRASVVTMAGYVARLKDWRRFESKARRLLRRQGIEVLHAKRFQDRDGAFKGWGAAKQLGFVEALYECAGETGVLVGFSQSTLKSVYRQRGQETGLNKNRSAYGWCFQMMVERMMKTPAVADLVHKHGMAFVIEAGNTNNGDVEAIFNRYVRTPEFGLAKAFKSITFVPKDSCVAIQFADFLAYYTRRHTEACIAAGGPLGELPPYIEIAKRYLPHDGFVATDFGGPETMPR